MQELASTLRRPVRPDSEGKMRFAKVLSLMPSSRSTRLLKEWAFGWQII